MKICDFLVGLTAMLLASLSFSAMASFMTEKEMHDFRQIKYKNHDILFEDASIQVLADKDCGYQDLAYFGPGASDVGVMHIELLRSKDKKRKAITVLVYHKNKGLDEPIIETSSKFKTSAYNADWVTQAFEPDEGVVAKALATYVPKVVARCKKAEFILARQEFHQVEKTKGQRRLPFNTYLAFEKDGEEWSLEDTYATRDVKNHTIRSIIGNPENEKHYVSIKNPNYDYYDGVFLRDRGGLKTLPGIEYKGEAFWDRNFKLSGKLFRKVFEGYFDGAKREHYYHRGFVKLIEANSVQCGPVLKGEVGVLTIESYTEVTNGYGWTYKKDRYVQKIKLKTKYADTFNSSRKKPLNSVRGLNVSINAFEQEISDISKLRDESYRFIELSGCESAVTNQLLENYYRSLSNLKSLQENARK